MDSTSPWPVEDINDDPPPSGLYEWTRVDIYAGSLVAFFDVLVIPTMNKSMGGVLRVTGLWQQGVLMEWEDPVGGHVWRHEFVGRGMKWIKGQK